MLTFRTLQRRFIFLLLVPVTLFLLGFGVLGYRFIQNILFTEWQEIAILRLERAAHQMDMRLHGQMQWMETFARAGQDPQGEEIQRWLLQQIKSQPGVSQVNLTWEKAAETKSRTAVPDRSAEMSPIGYFYPPDGKTVGLRGELLDQAGKPLGRLEVLLSYDYLMQDILTEGWMVAQMACLVNQEGHYLAHSSPAMQVRHCLGETQDPLELAMLKAMKEKPYGTLMGEGYIPEHVIGYYKLARRSLGHHAARPGQPDPGPYLAIPLLLSGGRHPVPGRHPGAHPPGGEAGGHGHPPDCRQGRPGGPGRLWRASAGYQP